MLLLYLQPSLLPSCAATEPIVLEDNVYIRVISLHFFTMIIFNSNVHFYCATKMRTTAAIMRIEISVVDQQVETLTLGCGPNTFYGSDMTSFLC